MKTLIGRSAEKNKLFQVLDEVHKNKGRTVLISGEAGVGKSQFVEEVLSKCGLRIYTSRANEEGNPPYGLFTNILRSYFRNENKIDCGPLTKYLSIIIPEVGTPPKDVDADTLKEAVISALLNISDEKAAAFYLDDIQWADNSSIDIIPLIAERSANSPIAVVCTYRSDEITRGHRIRKLRSELRRARQLIEINIEPLDSQNTRILIEDYLSNKVSDLLAQKIFAQTQGIPLFIEELLEALLEKDMLINENGIYEFSGMADIPIPESIKDSVLQRLTSLSEGSKKLLETASILGLQFEISMLVKISTDEKGLDELFDKNWLIETGNNTAEFKHALIREAVNSELSWSKRKQLHKAAAEYLENNNGAPEIIAEHWLESNNKEKARKFLIDSIENSCNMYAYKDAAEIANKTLEIWPEGIDNEKRVEVLMKYSYCSQLSGKFSDSIRALKEIIDTQNNDPKILGNAYRSLAHVYGMKASWDYSISSRLSAAENFESARQFADAALELLLAAGRYTGLLQLDKALEISDSAYKMAEKADKPDIAARALGLYGNLLSMIGKFEEGTETAQKALTIALENNESDAASEVYRRLASTMDYASNYSGSKNAYINAYDYCVSQGQDVNAQVCLSCMSYTFFQTGEWKRSLEICKQVLNGKNTPATSIPVGYGMTGIIQAFRGETKSALKYLNKSLRLTKNYNVVALELPLYWGFAVLYEMESEIGLAEENYNLLISKWHEIQDMHDVIPALMWGSAFFCDQGIDKKLTQCAEILAKIAALTGNPEAMAALAFSLGESSTLNRNYNEAVNQYLQALDHLEKLEIPLEHVFTEYRLSLAAIKNNDKKTAEKYLNNAYRTAKNMGMRPLAAKISIALSEIGLSAEEERKSESFNRINKAGLTKRQSEILELVAEGLTNKEIAEKLFLSARTVDMHISNILERLNCRTRTEAISKAKEIKVIQ